MSLTMRLGPAAPDDSRGAISVVAIPTPSFSVRGQKPACPEFDRAQTRTLDYKASALPDAGRNPPTDARGTRLGTYPRGAYPDSGFSFEKLRDVAELIISGHDQFGSGDLLELGIVLFQANIQEIRRRFIVFMSAALGFGHNGVDASQLDQIFGGNTHSLRGELALFGLAPHDRSAGFRGDHGINGVLHHENAVRDRYVQRPARSTFAGHGSEDPHLKPRRLAQR